MGETVPLLEARDVSVAHDGLRVLSPVSLEVAPGTIHAIVGPNGAGKSTLLAALLGQVAFSGKVLCHWRKSGRVAFVPQTFTADRTLPLTVAEFLAMSRQRLPICLGLRAATRARVKALLEQVGLPELGARRLGALSGGEVRRVLLANAVDPEPELLLLDEPGGGLDRRSIERLEASLVELRERGVTVLMVSHDHEQVRRLADQVTTLGAAGTPRTPGPAEAG
jgi:zinc transport system ATP-binding protein